MNEQDLADMRAAAHTDIIDRIMKLCPTNKDVDELLIILAVNLDSGLKGDGDAA